MLDWSDYYSIGNERIDFQHRIFLSLLNEFSQKMESGILDELNRTLQELIKYAEYHFKSEENLMIDYGYPELERHKVLHNYLLSKVKVKAHELELGICGSQDVLIFLHEWFVLHVTHEDKKIGNYIHEHIGKQATNS